MRRAVRGAMIGLAAAMLLVAPANAQFSDSYKFIKAVRDKDGAKVTEMIDKPGSTFIDSRDASTGEAALHIVIKRRDNEWLAFLLAKGAKPDIRDRDGNTPMGVAAQLGFADGVATLIEWQAGVNVANGRGETPLIFAVQKRDLALVRLLLANGANARLPDRVAGMSARDYAAADPRAAPVLKLIDEAKPVKPAGKVSGPVF